jgi:hypothetical protein
MHYDAKKIQKDRYEEGRNSVLISIINSDVPQGGARKSVLFAGCM